MKQKIFTTVLAMSLGVCSPLITYAKSCQEDATEMHTQIEQYGAITTVDQYKISLIRNVSGFETCGAEGYLQGKLVCPLTWKMHNWGNTVQCDDTKK